MTAMRYSQLAEDKESCVSEKGQWMAVYNLKVQLCKTNKQPLQASRAQRSLSPPVTSLISLVVPFVHSHVNDVRQFKSIITYLQSQEQSANQQ